MISRLEIPSSWRRPVPAVMPVITVSKGMPRAVWVWGSKKISARRTFSPACLQIGVSQVEEVLLGTKYAGAFVVDVEERLEVGELVGSPHLFDESEPQGTCYAGRGRTSSPVRAYLRCAHAVRPSAIRG